MAALPPTPRNLPRDTWQFLEALRGAVSGSGQGGVTVASADGLAPYAPPVAVVDDLPPNAAPCERHEVFETLPFGTSDAVVA